MPNERSHEDERKAELIARVRAAHARLDQALAAFGPQLDAEGMVGGWSVKATLGHITWWEQVVLHALSGAADEDILPGEAWDIDRANTRLFVRNQARPLGDILSDFSAAYAALVKALEAMPAARLDEASPYGGRLTDLIAGSTCCGAGTSLCLDRCGRTIGSPELGYGWRPGGPADTGGSTGATMV